MIFGTTKEEKGLLDSLFEKAARLQGAERVKALRALNTLEKLLKE